MEPGFIGLLIAAAISLNIGLVIILYFKIRAYETAIDNTFKGTLELIKRLDSIENKLEKNVKRKKA